MKINLRYGIILIILMFLIPFVSGIITTDEITETSIVWNISDLSSIIDTIAFDGVVLNDLSPNITRVVQNNLYHDETHIITVIDTLGNKYEQSAKTSPSAYSGQQSLMNTINIYIFLIFVIVFLFVGAFVPMASFGAIIFGFFGILNSMGNSFLMGLLFFILILVAIIELKYG